MHCEHSAHCIIFHSDIYRTLFGLIPLHVLQGIPKVSLSFSARSWFAGAKVGLRFSACHLKVAARFSGIASRFMAGSRRDVQASGWHQIFSRSLAGNRDAWPGSPAFHLAKTLAGVKVASRFPKGIHKGLALPLQLLKSHLQSGVLSQLLILAG